MTTPTDPIIVRPTKSTVVSDPIAKIPANAVAAGDGSMSTPNTQKVSELDSSDIETRKFDVNDNDEKVCVISRYFVLGNIDLYRENGN